MRGQETGPEAIAIVGAGSIGIALAIVFAMAGRTVRVHDSIDESVRLGRERTGSRLGLLTEFGLLDEESERILDRIEFTGDLEAAVDGVAAVFECTPEDLELKRQVFSTLGPLVGPDTVLASTSSAILPSELAGELPMRRQCLVVHPANPPYLLPVVEVVPGPFTAPEILFRVERILSDAGMEVVRIRRELTGFVYNRLQGALLREAYCLVRDGIIDVEGVDALVRGGLGLRWSVVGPFETADLNTRGGIAAHATRLGPAYERMGAERGQFDPWTPELVAEVVAQRRSLLPLSQWEERVAWRDRQLASLRRWRRATKNDRREHNEESI